MRKRGRGLGIYGDGDRDGVELKDKDINQIRIDRVIEQQAREKFLNSVEFEDSAYAYTNLINMNEADYRIKSHYLETLTFVEDQHHVFEFEKNNRTVISGCMFTTIGLVSVYAVGERTHLNTYINERFFVRRFDGFFSIQEIFELTHRFILDLKKIQHLEPREMRQAKGIIQEGYVEKSKKPETKTPIAKRKRGRPRKNSTN